jgi:hypothetical protein
MDDFMNTYFGPLGKEWCNYFYFLSILAFLTFVFYVLFFIYAIIKKPSSLNLNFISNSVFVLLYSLIAYYINRLLHTMCINSVN